MSNKDNIVKNETCFNAHERYNLPCAKKSCRCWFSSEKNLNCVNLAARQGPEKQEEIGEHFNLTRMRVCQIEKAILYKIRKTTHSNVIASHFCS